MNLGWDWGFIILSYTFGSFQVPLAASIILSVYFLAVVSSYYHELVAPGEIIKMKEKATVSPVVVFSDKDIGVKITAEEETVLVALESDSPPPPRHPLPDEVIVINPFLTDVFEKKNGNQELDKPAENDKKIKEINLKANFTPFKKSKTGDKTPAKMKVFLPGTGGDESDFDFSFNDPDFDSSLCAEAHEGVEENQWPLKIQTKPKSVFIIIFIDNLNKLFKDLTIGLNTLCHFQVKSDGLFFGL